MAAPRAFHVYALLCPDTGQARYVGKAKDVADRFKQHVQNAQRSVRRGGPAPKNRCAAWLYGLAMEGREPELAILEEVPISEGGTRAYGDADLEARTLEQAWIGRLQNAGHPLTNFNSDPCGRRRDLIRAAAERGRNLALSLGVSPAELLED